MLRIQYTYTEHSPMTGQQSEEDTYSHGDSLPFLVIRNCKTRGCDTEMHLQPTMTKVIKNGEKQMLPVADIHCAECKERRREETGEMVADIKSPITPNEKVSVA